MTTNIVSTVVHLLNGPILPGALAIGCVVYFAWAYYKANRIANENRKAEQQNLANKTIIVLPHKDYVVACAGSKESDACKKVSAVDIEACNFCDSEGKPLDLTMFDCFVVHGGSMKYTGINDGDFILVEKDFSSESLSSFTEILVLRSREIEYSKPLYKVRRAWYMGNIDESLRDIAKKIMNMPQFAMLKNQEGFKGEIWMIDDLVDNRYKEYQLTYFKDGVCPDTYKQIVISTTFDTIKKEIHFSIHPISLIVGVVKESYSIK